MLKNLRIQNLILIDDIELDLSQGFIAFTGETGAGKSIILDALMLTLGDRGGAKLIKNPDKASCVSATFSISHDSEARSILENAGIAVEDSELIIRRTLSPDGKSKAYINDTLVNLNLLASLKPYLIEIAGQHDNRGLMDSSTHLDIVDKLLNHPTILQDVAIAFSSYQESLRHFNSLKNKSDSAGIESDYLKSLIKELSDLRYKIGEEEELIELKRSLDDRSKICETASRCIEILEQSGLLSKLYSIRKDLSKYSPTFDNTGTYCDKALSELEEFKAAAEEVLNKYDSALNLESVEDRLYKIKSTARKFSIEPMVINEFLEQKKAELATFENLEDELIARQKAMTIAKEAFLSKATELTKLRHFAAKTLENKVNSSLASLKMEKAEFKASIEQKNDAANWNKLGVDSIKFIVRTNPNTPFGEIGKIASGGELSRIMLAIKSAQADSGKVETIVFDEIDTGISGAVADAVGRKISGLSVNYQVLCVTHQPQVAAYSNTHLLVEKQSSNDNAIVNIRKLDQDQKAQEIARMISGEEITSESLQAANKLIQSAG